MLYNTEDWNLLRRPIVANCEIDGRGCGMTKSQIQTYWRIHLWLDTKGVKVFTTWGHTTLHDSRLRSLMSSEKWVVGVKKWATLESLDHSTTYTKGYDGGRYLFAKAYISTVRLEHHSSIAVSSLLKKSCFDGLSGFNLSLLFCFNMCEFPTGIVNKCGSCCNGPKWT